MRFKNCKKCGKDCCIFKNNSGFTFVGISNAREIKRKIKKDYSFFLDYSPLPKTTIKFLKEDDPALEGKLRYSQLDKNRLLRLKTKNKKCIFLNSKGKCDIYSIRPNICRIYPFWAIKLNNKKIKVISHDTNPLCHILKFKAKSETGFPILSKQKVNAIIKLFKKIEKETNSYNKDIKKFSKWVIF